MAIKINFDPCGNPESPTLILARKNGNKLGQLNAKNIILKDCLSAIPELSFKVHKYINNKKDLLWDELKNLRLVYCKEWDMWFEATVETDEFIETVKIVQCKRLGDAETSQTKLYDREINTEIDISRDDYELPTTLYNEERPDASLLHRIMDEMPHYSLSHVDYTIADIQRIFTFDNVSVYDAFQQIAEEIGCLFLFNSNSDSNGKIQRTISVYDLETNCLDCGHRGEFTGVCPECGSTNIKNGYGEDTTIFITADELADEIQFSTDTGATKNCLKLEGGDDLMTATIRNCNPNGTDRIWYIPPWQKEDMSNELIEKLSSYDNDYKYYQNEYPANIDSSATEEYNALVEKYLKYNEDLTKIESPIVGYSNLMVAYYEAIDFGYYLQSTFMPDVSMSDTTATKQAALLTVDNLSPVAVSDVSKISLTTADSSVLAMAKAVIDARYQVKIESSSLENQTWKGNFTVTNYSDEEDFATSATISLTLNDDYELFVEQKLQKALKKSEIDDLSIVALFKMEYDDFCVELTKYCLSSLEVFLDACQACLDILIEQGIADDEAWVDSDPNLYETLYVPYYEKLKAIENEISIREKEIIVIRGEYDTNGGILSYGLQTYIEEERDFIQEQLDFQNYLGEELWIEFCAFRREDKYSNSNYISDGLTNAELFDRALEFIKIANKEIYKSAELQHSISSTLKNLLVIEKFRALTDHFSVGNWIRVSIDDSVYKLRLLDYEIDYDNLSNINVNFSDVLKIADGVSDLKSVLDKSSSMASSYDSVKKQAEQGAQGNSMLNNWVNKSLDTTLVKLTNGSENQSYIADSHGMLFRQYDPMTDTFSDEQLKIINSMIAFTKDNWKTSQTAVGKFTYYDPKDGTWKESYGVIADTIVGNIILSENVGIFNENNSICMNDQGFVITANGDDGVLSDLFTIQKQTTVDDEKQIEKLLYVNENGDLVLNGSVKISAGNSTDEDSLENKIENAGSGGAIGGRNFIKDSDIEWTTIKDSPSYTTTMSLVDGLDLQQLVGAELSLSLYVNAPGDSQPSDSGDTDISNRYGIHGTARWIDSTGTNTETLTKYPLILFNHNVGVENQRVSTSQVLTPPEGYDTLNYFFISVQQTLKPAENNDATWVMGYPQLEIGRATDWNPAPEDITTDIERINSQLADLEVTAEGIISNVQENTTTISGLVETTKTLETTVEQLPEGIRIEVSEQIETSLEGYEELKENVNTNFNFGADGLVIGKTGSIYKQKLSDDRWAITANEEEKIYIDGETGQLGIPEVEITGRLAFLGYAWSSDSAGNVNLEYVGGDS